MSQYLFKHFSRPGITPPPPENCQHVMGIGTVVVTGMVVVMIIGMVVMMTVVGGWKYTESSFTIHRVAFVIRSTFTVWHTLFSQVDNV